MSALESLDGVVQLGEVFLHPSVGELRERSRPKRLDHRPKLAHQDPRASTMCPTLSPSRAGSRDLRHLRNEVIACR
jgi:hypothetical protein